MKAYKVYRSIRISDISELNTESLGISWSADEISAINYSEQFMEDFIVISANVTSEQINIEQTLAQWEQKEYEHENEVVLKEFVDITFEHEGNILNGNTGAMNDGDFETRPNPINCEEYEVLDYLDEAF